MPYIATERRPPIDKHLDPLLRYIAARKVPKGDIAYMLWRIVLTWARTHSPSYDGHSNAKAVLQDVHDLYHNRYMEPHEARAIQRNGDVMS